MNGMNKPREFWIAKSPEDQQPYDCILSGPPLEEFKEEYIHVCEVLDEASHESMPDDYSGIRTSALLDLCDLERMNRDFYKKELDQTQEQLAKTTRALEKAKEVIMSQCVCHAGIRKSCYFCNYWKEIEKIEREVRSDRRNYQRN